MKSIAIIPCFNDNDYLNHLLKSDNFYNQNIDVLIIDDGSNQEVLIDNLSKSIILIKNKTNRGKGYSIKKGLNYAIDNGYTHAITLDADLQHDPDYIDKFLAIDVRINIVIGARDFNHNMPFHRRFSNKITSGIISMLVGKKILDSQSGYRRYKLYSKSFNNCSEDGFQFESEVLINELRLQGSKVEHVFIPTIYNNQKSSINNITDTYKFIKLILRKIIVR